MSYFYAPPPPPPPDNNGTTPKPAFSVRNTESDEEDEETQLAKKLAYKGHVPIQGTSVVLITPEDIENWREERRRNWPTKKRVQEKLERAKADVEKEERNPKKQKTLQDDAADPKGQRKCTFFMKSGKCRFGDKCKYSHDRSTSTTAKSTTSGVVERDLTGKVYQRYKAPPKMTLYKKLFRTDIMKENETLLAFISHLNERGLLD